MKRTLRAGILAGLTLLCGGLYSQNLTVLGGTTFLVEPSTDVNVIGNVNIQTAGNIDNSGIFSLTGNWTNNGNGLINVSPGTVVFNGNSNQNIQGGAVTDFYNLKINNPSGVTLGSNQNVGGLLDFDNGKINTGSNTLNLTANPPVAITGANTSRYVNGNLEIAIPAGSNTVKYEIGSAVYAPMTLALNGVSNAGSIRAHTAAGASPNENNPTPNASHIDPNARAGQHWITTNNGVSFGSSNATFDFSNTNNTGNEAEYIVAKFDVNTWTLPVSTLNGTTVTASGLTALNSEFQVGEDGTIGIQEIGSGVIGTVEVFPIPATQNMTVQFYSEVNDVFRINMVDMTGRVVLSHTKNAGKGTNRQELDVESLSDGMYLVTIQGAGSTHATHVLVK